MSDHRSGCITHLQKYCARSFPEELFTTHCLDEKVPVHAALLKKQQINRRGQHDYVFSAQLYQRYFDYKFARQKYGWSLDQPRRSGLGV